MCECVREGWRAGIDRFFLPLQIEHWSKYLDLSVDMGHFFSNLQIIMKPLESLHNVNTIIKHVCWALLSSVLLGVSKCGNATIK